MMDRRYFDHALWSEELSNRRTYITISPSRNFGQEKIKRAIGKLFDRKTIWFVDKSNRWAEHGPREEKFIGQTLSLSLPMKNKIHPLKRKSLSIELNVYPKNKFRSFYYQILISNYPLEITRWHTNEKIRTSKVK